MKYNKLQLFPIKITYVSLTDTKGSRIKLSYKYNTMSSKKSVSKTISYNYEFNNILDGAIDFLESQNIEVLSHCHYENYSMIFIDWSNKEKIFPKLAI